MNVVRYKKRAMFVGCSHGTHINQRVADEVLAFKADYQPRQVIHLGDAWDVAALRSGAEGSTDESSSLLEDSDAAVGFLVQLQPTVFFMGNHEDRFYHMKQHGRSVIADCAAMLVARIEQFFESIHCEIVPYASIMSANAWRLFGDTVAGHGFLFGEMCTRDHCELLNGMNVIHAHDHRMKMQGGRTVSGAIGRSVGTLADIPSMHYAKTRRATASWSGGIVYGEYGDGWSQWEMKLLHTREPTTWTKPELDKPSTP